MGENLVISRAFSDELEAIVIETCKYINDVTNDRINIDFLSTFLSIENKCDASITRPLGLVSHHHHT